MLTTTTLTKTIQTTNATTKRKRKSKTIDKAAKSEMQDGTLTNYKSSNSIRRMFILSSYQRQ